jgi:hypothetical protein
MFMTAGEAATPDLDALGVPAGMDVQLTEKLRSVVVPSATVTVRGFIPPTVQLLATPLRRTLCSPAATPARVATDLTPIGGLEPPS